MADSITSSNWKTQSPLSVATSNASVATWDGRLFSLGGGSPLEPFTSAPVDSDGRLGSWSVCGHPPQSTGATMFARGVFGDNGVMIFSMLDTAPSSSFRVYTGKVGAGGGIGRMTSSDIPTTAAVSVIANLVISGDYIYRCANEIWSSPISIGGLSWKQQSKTPAALPYASFVTYGEYLYQIGGTATPGQAAAVVSTVYSARIEPGGSLGVWKLVGSLPVGLWKAAAVVYKNKLIVLGGQNAGGTNLDTMYVSKLEPGGSLGGFVSDVARIPRPCRLLSACVVGRRLYIAGGFDGAADMANVDSIDLGP